MPLTNILLKTFIHFFELKVRIHFEIHFAERLKDWTTGKMLASMAFKSTFVIPKNYTFGRGRLEEVKTSAAKFLVNTFEEIKNNLNNAAESSRPI